MEKVPPAVNETQADAPTTNSPNANAPAPAATKGMHTHCMHCCRPEYLNTRCPDPCMLCKAPRLPRTSNTTAATTTASRPQPAWSVVSSAQASAVATEKVSAAVPTLQRPSTAPPPTPAFKMPLKLPSTAPSPKPAFTSTAPPPTPAFTMSYSQPSSAHDSLAAAKKVGTKSSRVPQPPVPQQQQQQQQQQRARLAQPKGHKIPPMIAGAVRARVLLPSEKAESLLGSGNTLGEGPEPVTSQATLPAANPSQVSLPSTTATVAAACPVEVSPRSPPAEETTTPSVQPTRAMENSALAQPVQQTKPPSHIYKVPAKRDSTFAPGHAYQAASLAKVASMASAQSYLPQAASIAQATSTVPAAASSTAHAAAAVAAKIRPSQAEMNARVAAADQAAHIHPSRAAMIDHGPPPARAAQPQFKQERHWPEASGTNALLGARNSSNPSLLTHVDTTAFYDGPPRTNPSWFAPAARLFSSMGAPTAPSAMNASILAPPVRQFNSMDAHSTPPSITSSMFAPPVRQFNSMDAHNTPPSISSSMFAPPARQFSSMGAYNAPPGTNPSLLPPTAPSSSSMAIQDAPPAGQGCGKGKSKGQKRKREADDEPTQGRKRHAGYGNAVQGNLQPFQANAVPARYTAPKLNANQIADSRNVDNENIIWASLVAHIKSAVDQTAAKHKPFNGSNRAAAWIRVDAALARLRPLILVDEPEED